MAYESDNGQEPKAVEPSFPPIRSTYDPQVYRVVVSHLGMEYIIHTGDNMFRILTEDKLPDEISSKLTMIKAYEPYVVLSELRGMANHTPYINTFPNEFWDIGWCVGTYPNTDNKMYCLLLDLSLLKRLRGE